MKKTDFPDKCSGCRLLNREKMRAALEGDKTKKSTKEKPSEYAISIVEDKKGRAKTAKKVGHRTVTLVEANEEGPTAFAELIKDGSKKFPKLPE